MLLAGVSSGPLVGSLGLGGCQGDRRCRSRGASVPLKGPVAGGRGVRKRARARSVRNDNFGWGTKGP
eukprot:8132293-Alexandrium_andersonii.AAC.1